MTNRKLILMFYTAVPESVHGSTMYRVIEYCFNTTDGIDHTPAKRARADYNSGQRLYPETDNDREWLKAAIARYSAGSKSFSGKGTRGVTEVRERVKASVIKGQSEEPKEIKAKVLRHETRRNTSFTEVATLEDWKKVAVEMAGLLRESGYSVSVMETNDMLTGKCSAIVKIVW
jgi:hypothetical protein